MEYFVIGDEDTVLGFSLVGLSGQAVKNEDEAKGAWLKAIENKSYAIIIITEPIANMIRERVDRYLFSESFPLVVEIPAPGKTSDKNLRSLVNQAIGVSI